MREYIHNQQFDEERALYYLQHADVEDCVFAGPADGESVLKEARDVALRRCRFSLRYPLWHVRRFLLEDADMVEKTRAAIWYSHDGKIQNSDLGGIKALRECQNVAITGKAAVGGITGLASASNTKHLLFLYTLLREIFLVNLNTILLCLLLLLQSLHAGLLHKLLLSLKPGYGDPYGRYQ